MIVPDRWRMLFVLFLARTAMAYQFQTVPSAGPLLIDELGLSFTQLGTLIGLYMLAGIPLALPSGMLAQRFSAERMVLGGLALMVVGGAMMGSQSIPLIFTGRLLSGLGAVFLNVLMTKMVTDWFAGREIIAAMAVFVSSWPLGIALGLVSFPALAAAYGWASVMYAAAASVLICLVLVAADLPCAAGRARRDRREPAYRPLAPRMAADLARGLHLGLVQRRLCDPDQLPARPVRAARLFPLQRESCRKRARLGRHRHRAALGLSRRAAAAAEPDDARRLSCRRGRGDRTAGGGGTDDPARGDRDHERAAGRPDHGAAGAGAAPGKPLDRNGRVLHVALRLDGGAARACRNGARYLGRRGAHRSCSPRSRW